MIARLPIPMVLGLLLAAGCSAQPGSHAHHGAPSAPPAGGAPVLFDNLGDYHRTITTTSRQAQAYFDQGLRLVYGFNHHEARPPSVRRRGSIPRARCACGVAR